MSTSHNAFLPPDLRKLIEGDRQAADPSEAVRQDVARRVDRALGLGGAMLIPLPGIAASKWSSAAGPSVAPAAAGIAAWKIAVGVAVVALAGGGGFTLASRQAGAPAIHDQSTMTVGGRDAPQAAPGANAAAEALIANSALPSVSLDLDAPASLRSRSTLRRRQSCKRNQPSAHVPRALRIVFLTSVKCSIAHAVRSSGTTRPTLFRRFVRTRSRLLVDSSSKSARACACWPSCSHTTSARRAPLPNGFTEVYARSMFLPVVDRALESAR